MADDSILEKFGSFFRAGDLNDPRVNPALRQRIALQMMAGQKRGYPKNVGEGLTAIGDSLGEIGVARQLAQADLAQQGIQPPPAAGQQTSEAAPAAATPAVAGADVPVTAPVMARSELADEAAPEAAAPINPFNTTSPPIQAGAPAPTLPPPVSVQPPPEPGVVRNAIARTLANRTRMPAPGGPPPNPTLAGGEPPAMGLSALATTPSPDGGLPPEITTGASAIRPAPPVPSRQIQRAPPPAQVAQAGQQQQYPAGFVPPEPGNPAAPPVVPMKPREVQLRQWLAANQTNPYAAMKVAPELSTLEAERTTQQNAVNKLYEAQIARGTEQARLRVQAQIDQAKRVADYQKQQQELIQPAATSPNGVPVQMAGPGAPSGTAYDTRLGTPYSPQRIGSPTVPAVPPGETPQLWAEKQAPEMVKAVSAYEKAVPAFDEAIKTLRLAANHPGREWGVGSTSEIAKRMPGTAAYGFGKIMEQIGGKNFLNAYQQLKGGGSITEIEGSKAEAAQARLSTAQNKKDFDRALIDFANTLRQDLETVQRKVNRPVTAWRGATDNSSFAPDIGERRGSKEYIGGDPSDAMSWRNVQ